MLPRGMYAGGSLHYRGMYAGGSFAWFVAPLVHSAVGVGCLVGFDGVGVAAAVACFAFCLRAALCLQVVGAGCGPAPVVVTPWLATLCAS